MPIFVLALALCAGCATTAQESSASGALARVQFQHVLVVGTAASMPQAEHDHRAGRGHRLDVDLALERWTRTWLQGPEASGALDRMRDRWFKDASWLGELR